MSTTNLPISQEAREAAVPILRHLNAKGICNTPGEADQIRQAFQRAITQADAAGYRRGVVEAAKVALGMIFDSPHDPGRQIASAILALNKDQTDES